MGSNGRRGEPQLPKPDGLARQGSSYNLTLYEAQQQLGDLGKPLRSMNLDELLAPILIEKENGGGFLRSLTAQKETRRKQVVMAFL